MAGRHRTIDLPGRGRDAKDRGHDGGTPRARHAAPAGAAANDGLVGPTRAIRMLGALRRTLDELEHVDLDDAARERVIAAHRAALIEVASTVSDALIAEMVALHIEPLPPGATLDQLVLAKAQLVGWVEGLVLSETNLLDAIAASPVLAVVEPPVEQAS